MTTETTEQSGSNGALGVRKRSGQRRLVGSLLLLSGVYLNGCGSGGTGAPPIDPGTVSDHTFYVDSTTGDDANSGQDEQHPWKTLSKVSAASLLPGDTVLFRRGSVFRGTLAAGENSYAHSNGGTQASLRFGAYGTGAKPVLVASEALDLPSDWVSEGNNIWRSARSFPHDIGNILFVNGGAISVGFKKFAVSDLKAEKDFFYDLAGKRASGSGVVKIFSASNPAAGGSLHVELAANVPNVYLENAHNVTVEDLDLRYAGSHGVAAANSDRITVRRLDISWIGGANEAENSGASAMPVRYGNGVQFYANMSDSVVEGCRIWEIYDTGVTNQYSGTTSVSQKNISYRFNTIWNVGMAALEVWADSGSTISEVKFDHNTCFNAGFGWGSQRTTPVGGHLVWWYGRTGLTTNVQVRNNILDTSLRGLVIQGDAALWNSSNVLADYNGFGKGGTAPAGIRVNSGGGITTFANLAALQAATGWDTHSLEGSAMFINPAGADFRLAATSPFRQKAPALGYTADGDGNPLSGSGPYNLGASQAP